jgi:hypothetical protein
MRRERESVGIRISRREDLRQAALQELSDPPSATISSAPGR